MASNVWRVLRKDLALGPRSPIVLWALVLPIVLTLLIRGVFGGLFETEPQDRPVQVVEAERTPELSEYLDLVSGAVNYVNQTFSLFKAAEARRPETLLSPRKR